MRNYDHLYNRTYYGETLTEDHRKERDLRWRVLPDAVVLPHKELQDAPGGGLLDDRGAYVDGSGLHRGMGRGYGVSPGEIDEYEEDVVFLGAWAGIWGHCLTDNIRRLWVLNDGEFMDRYGHLRFVYVPMFEGPVNRSFRELLDILGAGKVRIEAIDRIKRFRRVILPDECFWREDSGSRQFTGEYVEMIDRIRDHGEKNLLLLDDRKLYFTYRRYTSCRCMGEKAIEEFFADMGYRIVSPEEYSFSEQLNMLLNCSEYASTIGSLSHNCIFLRDGAKATLIPRAGFIPEYQLALDQVHDIDVTYVDSSLSLYSNPERPWEGPFYLIVSRNLQECFGRRRDEKTGGLGFRIYRNLGHEMNGTSEPAEYYKSVWADYPFVDPAWRGRENPIVRLLRRYRFWEFIALCWNRFR